VKTDWVNVASIIMVFTIYLISSAVMIPIVLIGKDTTIPAYKVLMDVFIYIELVGGGILALTLYLPRRARKGGGP